MRRVPRMLGGGWEAIIARAVGLICLILAAVLLAAALAIGIGTPAGSLARIRGDIELLARDYRGLPDDGEAASKKRIRAGNSKTGLPRGEFTIEDLGFGFGKKQKEVENGKTESES